MVDKARTVACDREFIEVLVANPSIADVVTLSNKQLYVLGKSAGITNISLVGPDKRVLGVVQVEVAHDLRDMTQRIRQLIPDGDIVVTSVKGKVLLTGTVRDTVSLSRAMAIAEQFAPGAVTNTLVVRGSQQVSLEVRFVEASRDAQRDLGIGWDVNGKRVRRDDRDHRRVRVVFPYSGSCPTTCRSALVLRGCSTRARAST